MSDVSSSEKGLIEGLSKGSEIGFEELMDRFTQQLYSFCYNLTLNADISEEIIAELFSSSVDQFGGSLEIKDSLIEWFFKSAVEKVAERESNSDATLNNSISTSLVNAIVTDDISDMMSDQVSSESLMHSAIQALPFEYRVVFLLQDSHGFSIERISKMLSISDLETKAYLHRGRLMIFRYFKNKQNKTICKNRVSLNNHTHSEFVI